MSPSDQPELPDQCGKRQDHQRNREYAGRIHVLIIGMMRTSEYYSAKAAELEVMADGLPDRWAQLFLHEVVEDLRGLAETADVVRAGRAAPRACSASDGGR